MINVLRDDIMTPSIPLDDKRKIHENCLICEKPLEEPFRSLHWKYHKECRNCKYCNKEVQLEIVDKEFNNGETICHKPCEERFMDAEFRQRPVMITQEKLDYLNRINLMFEANLELSIETNQSEAALLAPLLAATMAYDQLFLTVKRMEAITAQFSIALSKDKSKALSMIEARQKVKFQEVEEYRKKQQEPKPPKAVKAKTEHLTPDEKIHRNMIAAYQKMFPHLTEEEIVDQIVNKAKRTISNDDPK